MTSPNPPSTLLQRFACARLSGPCLPKSCPGVSATLTTTAFARSSLRGLRSAPDHRTRRALLHLSYSCAPQITYAALVTHGPTRTFGLSTTERYEHLLDSVNRSYRSAEWSSKPGRASSRNLCREDGAMGELLAALAAQLLVVPLLDRLRAVAAIPPSRGWSRVRPGDPNWPSPTEWDGLRQRVGGRLIAVQLPLQPRREAPIGEACRIDTGAMAVPIAGVRFGYSTTRTRPHRNNRAQPFPARPSRSVALR